MLYQILVEDIFHNQMTMQARQGTPLFSALNELSSISFGGNCGGHGRCQACKVYSVTDSRELKACETLIESDMYIRLPFAFQSDIEPSRIYPGSISPEDRLGVAVDLGTTTIGMELWNLTNRELLATCNIKNPQVPYGADAISRVSHTTMHDAGKRLCSLLWKELICHIRQMLALFQAKETMISDIILSGNPIMTFLALNKDVSGLGTYPFTNTEISEFHIPLQEILPFELREDISFNAFYDAVIKGLPGICSLVGADILAGAYGHQLGQSEEYDLLMDLGTNGEMILLNQECGFSVSTACGPAFDGYVTNKEYGANILSRIGLLLQRGILSKDGSMMERYAKDGYQFVDGIRICQEDVRELQKAKAAILTGLQVLLETAGVSADQCHVYIAGNFGFHLDLEIAKQIGMLPEALEDVQIVGNSCLSGSGKLLFQYEEGLSFARKICNRTRYIDLANTPDYQNRYMEALELARK